MAYLYTRKNSPFWWASHRDPATGKRICRSLYLLANSRAETREAKEKIAELADEERDLLKRHCQEHWNLWVGPMLRTRHGGAHEQRTLERYLTAWRNIAAFLNKNGVLIPRQLTRAHLDDYVRWRQTGDEEVRACGHNTVRYELQLLGRVLKEAVARRFCRVDITSGYRFKKERAKTTPEITAADVGLIRDKLKSKPDWMAVSFEIAIHHGARLRATEVDLNQDVDWAREEITFHEKGDKEHVVPIAKGLLPLLADLKARGKTKSCVIPKDASKQWRRFFDEIDRPHYHFHCCRATVITQLARSGVPESRAMRFVGHASVLVHRLYQRLVADDLRCCNGALEKTALSLPVTFAADVSFNPPVVTSPTATVPEAVEPSVTGAMQPR